MCVCYLSIIPAVLQVDVDGLGRGNDVTRDEREVVQVTTVDAHEHGGLPAQ